MTSQQFAEMRALARKECALAVMRDYLALALDQLDTGSQDAQGAREMVSLLRPALRLAHARMEALSR